MSYATERDIIDRYGEDALAVVADRDGDGQPDSAAVANALEDASNEIDAYLASRYGLPLERTPGVLIRLCSDMAVYRLASTAGVVTEEQRQRYDDAVALLRRVAKGEISLGLPEQSQPESDARSGGVLVDAPERIFGPTTWEGY